MWGKISLPMLESNILTIMKSHALLSAMRNGCLAIGLVTGLHVAAQAQCNASTLSTTTYDTALTSNGFALYNLNFPQFNPDSGTLVAVRLTATVNSQYGFTLRNADSIATTYALTLGQQDLISGPQLSAPYSNVTTQSMGSYSLNSNQSVTKTPFNLLTNYVASDTVTAISPFLGAGQVSLNYQSFTFSNLSAVNNAAYYYSAGINTNVTFSVQYQFCRGNVVLATGLTAWTANLAGSNSVELNWAAANEVAGRQYVIQRSSDNLTYNDIATLNATVDDGSATYSYPDALPASAGSNWNYRLQIHDASGAVTYSPIRNVTLTTPGEGLQVYPNPATNFINLVPGQRDAGDWQVDILSVNGGLIERDVYMQTRNMQVNFRSKLSAGTYLVRATDLRGQKVLTSNFVVLAH
jgi:Secretion system C-terminal sorting domain